MYKRSIQGFDTGQSVVLFDQTLMAEVRCVFGEVIMGTELVCPLLYVYFQIKQSSVPKCTGKFLCLGLIRLGLGMEKVEGQCIGKAQ